MPKPVLEYSHKTSVYVFLGKKLDPPAPGTYDAAKWTPPTRQVFRVEIQDDGAWRILLQGADVACGDNATASRSAAKQLIEQHCSTHLEERR